MRIASHYYHIKHLFIDKISCFFVILCVKRISFHLLQIDRINRLKVVLAEKCEIAKLLAEKLGKNKAIV